MLIAFRQILFWTMLCGLCYPLGLTLMAQLVMPFRANGSPGPHGTELVGQHFTGDEYFWGRPSATGERPYNAASSSGSNLGPTEPKRREAHQANRALFSAEKVPPDLLSASGSGLDPHISPSAARFQVRRVAVARQVREEELNKLVEQHVEPATWGLLGAPRVNVLRLNLAVDATFRKGTP